MKTDLLAGGSDLHTHVAPSLFDRALDDFELAREAFAAGMRAVVVKSHECPSVVRAKLAEKYAGGALVYGGIVLNYQVGGFNVSAVEAALSMGGKFIWFPTISAKNYLDFLKKHGEGRFTPQAGPAGEGLTVFNSSGELYPEVIEILHMAAQADAVVASGHLGAQEIKVVVEKAREIGVRKILINHADARFLDLSLEDQIALAQKGAFLEKCYLNIITEDITIAEMVANIRAVGAESCVLVTDLGQKGNPSPVTGMIHFVNLLMKSGINFPEIKRMLVENPAFLLALS